MSSETPTNKSLDPYSWPFWRKRLSRALILGALVLVITQILPELPQDQNVVFVAPAGGSFREISISYLQETGGQALGGTHLVFPAPVTEIPHSIRVKNGRYTITIRATGSTSQGKAVTWEVTKRVTLKGESIQVAIRP